jgi:hypothetical protein
MKDFRCDSCNEDVEISEVGLLCDLDSDECSEHSNMTCLCKSCRDKELNSILDDLILLPAYKKKDYKWILEEYEFNRRESFIITSKIQNP